MIIDSVLKSRWDIEQYPAKPPKPISEPESEMSVWLLGLKFSVTKET